MPKELEDIVGFKLREPAATTAESRNLPPVWQAAVLGILVGYLYHTILWRLILNWWNDPNFSHGFFVPLFSIFVVWRERKRIGSLLPCPSWIGLPIIAGSLLSLFGVPVLREGNVIQLPAMSLEVAQACSGIRSLLSLATLSIIYGYLLESKTLPRLILLIASVPIAIVANSLRVVGSGLLVHYWDPAKGEGFFHTFEGWVIFVFSLGMLFSLHGLILFVERRGSRRESDGPH